MNAKVFNRGSLTAAAAMIPVLVSGLQNMDTQQTPVTPMQALILGLVVLNTGVVTIRAFLDKTLAREQGAEEPQEVVVKNTPQEPLPTEEQS